MRIRHLATLTVAILLLAPLVLASEEARYEVDEGDIYLGDPTSFSKPAVVDVDRVYHQIPEYRQIVERDIDQSDPKYLILMRKASDKFRAALRDAGDAEGYDLIGATGAIRPKGKDKGKRKVPDITKLVISKLPQ
jgi:hypothetical protein